MYETLLTEEEKIVAQDLGDYFRVPCDMRDLNYDKYFIEAIKSWIMLMIIIFISPLN